MVNVFDVFCEVAKAGSCRVVPLQKRCVWDGVFVLYVQGLLRVDDGEYSYLWNSQWYLYVQNHR